MCSSGAANLFEELVEIDSLPFAASPEFQPAAHDKGRKIEQTDELGADEL